MKPQGTKTQSKNEAIELTPRGNIFCGLKNSFVWFLSLSPHFLGFQNHGMTFVTENVTEYQVTIYIYTDFISSLTTATLMETLHASTCILLVQLTCK